MKKNNNKKMVTFDLHLYSKEQNKVFINGIECPISSKTKDDFFKLQNMGIKSRKVLHDNLLKTLRKNEFKQAPLQLKKHAKITFNHSNERMNQYASVKQGYYTDIKTIQKVIKEFKEKNEGVKALMYSNYEEIPNESKKDAYINKHGLYEVMVYNKVGYTLEFTIK